MTLRVAGGWVRDKILGLDSQDMDIALDNTSGQIFCESFKNFLNQESIVYKGYHLICQNVEKSKHLETATLIIFDK